MNPEIGAAAFIDFMVAVVGESVREYKSKARADVSNVGVSVGVNDGVNTQLLALLRDDPLVSAEALGEIVDKSTHR